MSRLANLRKNLAADELAAMAKYKANPGAPGSSKDKANEDCEEVISLSEDDEEQQKSKGIFSFLKVVSIYINMTFSKYFLAAPYKTRKLVGSASYRRGTFSQLNVDRARDNGRSRERGQVIPSHSFIFD